MPEITFISNRKEPGRIGSLVLDAILSDSHEFTNEVTEYPIEDGSNINDHIKRNPAIITINGFITGSPIYFLDALDNALISDIVEGNVTSLDAISSNRVTGAFSELLQMIGEYDSISTKVSKPKVIDIVTGLNIYSDMVITKLSINRSPEDGESLRFSATFKKIKKVIRETVLIPRLTNNAVSGNSESTINSEIQDKASSKKDLGMQTPKKLKSLAKRISESDLPDKVSDKLKNLFNER